MSQSSARSEEESQLYDLLLMVNDWLKFAEAKNGGLLALAGLSLTGLLSYATQVDEFIHGAAVLLIAGGVLWIGAILWAVYSFVPLIKPVHPTMNLKDTVDDTDNLFYFGHLANFSSETLLTALGVEQEGESHRARFERNLADQVITNRRITMHKLGLFDNATRWWAVGILFVTFGVLWSFLGGD